MDRLIIDNKEVEFGGEVGIYLTYRSNIMNPDISKILGNNSSTIKIPHTIHNASIIENAQMVMSDTRFPYIKHSADVLRDGIMLIQGATVILLRTTPEEYELSLVWGVSEGLRQMAEEDAPLSVLADYLTTQKVEWKASSAGSVLMPTALYGLMGLKYTYHPVVSLMEIMQAVMTKYSAQIIIPDKVAQELRELVMPILKDVQPKSIITLQKSASAQGDTTGVIAWNSVQDGAYNDGLTVIKDDVKIIGAEANIVAYISSGYIDTSDVSIEQGYYLSLIKRTPREEDGNTEYEESEILKIPAVRADWMTHPQYDACVKVLFIASLEDDYEAMNANDEILVRINDEKDTARFRLDGWDASTLTLTMQKQSTEVGEYYHIGENLPDLGIMKWLKGVMQMLGVYAFQGNDGNIYLTSYTSFFSQTANARDWSDYLCMTSTHASEEQEFKADGFFRKNWMRYKNDDNIKKMDFFFTVDSEILEAEGDYLTLPFDSVAKVEGDPVRPSIAKIPMYSVEGERGDDGVMYYTTKRNNSEEKKAHVLRNVETQDGYYLSRGYLSWEYLLQKYYQGIIQSIQQAHYITATFYLDAITLQRIDFRYPVYLSQYASYFAIIEIKTKKNNLAEVKLLKLV